VVRHYNDAGVGNDMKPLGLTDAEMADLVEFLRSL
jgi:cytochrome c1